MEVWAWLIALPLLSSYARFWGAVGEGALINQISPNPVTCRVLCGSAHTCLCTRMSVHTCACAHACLGWGVCSGCSGTWLGSNQSCLQCRHCPDSVWAPPVPRSWLQGPTVPCVRPAHMSSVLLWLSPHCDRPDCPLSCLRDEIASLRSSPWAAAGTLLTCPRDRLSH